VSNAVKFTPAGGRILVRGERAGSDLRLSVSDTGPGIPEQHLDAVFERFWQVTAGDGRGLGLGLYIARCIIDAHHGLIWAESPDTSGSTICLTLPDPHGDP
jgi:signal transduction histidine kinase